MHTAVFPGTFDPVTNGHLDIIERALDVCEHLIVAVAGNPGKGPLFSIHERVEMMITAVAVHGDRVSIASFDSLLVDFASKRGIRAIIRGVRGVSDFEDEFRMALANRRLCPEIETLFLMPSDIYTYLNSGLVKEIARLNGDPTPFVPPHVAHALVEKLTPNHP